MATIIKTGRDLPGAGTSQLPAFNFADMADQADVYLQKVRQEAARILEQTRQEADEIRQRAHTEGLQQATHTAAEQAREDLQQQLQTALPAFGQFVAELERSRQEWIRHWEHNAIHLASAIAARMMRREARQDPQITLGLIREALELAAGHGEITLRLNPDDYETLQSDLDRLMAELGKLGPTTIVPDPLVTRAGCLVQTQFGTIDQQIEAQAARIEEELKT